jgi:hypothetical protein
VIVNGVINELNIITDNVIANEEEETVSLNSRGYIEDNPGLCGTGAYL